MFNNMNYIDFIENKSYSNRIEFSAGQSIESAYKDLQEYAPAYGDFNDHTIYSFETLDEIFQKIVGMTKDEYYKYAKEQEEKRQQELKTYKERIPELTTYYKDKARGIIPENKLKYWDRIVPIRLDDMYRGMELDCWLELIKILNDDKKPKEKRLKKCCKLFYKQGHSGMSGFLVLAGLKELHPLGYEVAAYINKRQEELDND